MRELSPAQFAAHLVQSAALGEVVSHYVVDRAAKIIKKDAQGRLGTYQDGWAKLTPFTVEDRVSKGFTPDDPLLRTGALRDSIDAQSMGNEAVVGSASDIALDQECGTSRIPPRPFLAPAAHASKVNIEFVAAQTMMGWLKGASLKAIK